MNPVRLVSLVMPVWNPHPAWFPNAVSSALRESCDLELLLVDDGNDVPATSPVDDPRVRVVRAPHGGPYAARDVGLRAATGSHVRFIDADDEVVAGSTSALLAALGDTEQIAHGATEVCDEDLRVVSIAASSVVGDAVDSCVLGTFDVFHVSLLYPRRLLDRVGPWAVEGFRVSGDWDYVLRAVELAPVVPVAGVMTKYRRHTGSVMSSARIEDGGAARGLVLDRHFARRPERRGSRIERHAYGSLHLDQAVAHAWRGHRVPAARELVRAIRWRPLHSMRVAAGVVRQRLTRHRPGRTP